METLDVVKSELKALLDKLNKSLDLPYEKMKVYRDEARKWSKFHDNITDLDLDLRNYLSSKTDRNNQVATNKDIQHKLNDVAPESLIIYVKKAQLYKIYSLEGLKDFENDESTHYHRHNQYGPVYEVVRDAHPQKLMIVITDMQDASLVNEIKKNIMEFVENNTSFVDKATMNDLKVYNNENNAEFLLSNICMKNITEKDTYIEKFIKFMMQKGKPEIANKIQLRPPEPLELEGARFYKLPTIKEPIGHNTAHNMLGQLLTTPATANVKNSLIVQGNLTININSNNVNSNNTTVKKSSAKTIKSFYQYLYDTRPSWYKEDKFVNIETIEDAYLAYFKDKTNRTSISRQLNGGLFTVSARSHGITKKKLASYDALQNFIDDM